MVFSQIFRLITSARLQVVAWGLYIVDGSYEHSNLVQQQTGSPVAIHLISLLNARPGPTLHLWILGHKGFPGNEFAITTLLGPSPTHPRDLSSTDRQQIHHHLIRGQRKCMADFGGLKMAISNRVNRTLLHALKPVKFPYWKPTLTSLIPSRTHYAPPLCKKKL